jgi:hypothetical protein
MNRRPLSIDEKPGPLPEIRSNGDNVTFALPLHEVEHGLWLVVRCDAIGNVWVSSVISAGRPHLD